MGGCSRIRNSDTSSCNRCARTVTSAAVAASLCTNLMYQRCEACCWLRVLAWSCFHLCNCTYRQSLKKSAAVATPALCKHKTDANTPATHGRLTCDMRVLCNVSGTLSQPITGSHLLVCWEPVLGQLCNRARACGARSAIQEVPGGREPCDQGLGGHSQYEKTELSENCGS